MVPQLTVAENRRMGAPAPLDVYRQFQSFLINGEYGRLAEVADMDGYTERCAGLTGWTTGLQIALRKFQEGIASRLTDMVPSEYDVVQDGDMLVIRGSYEVTHSGEFLGGSPTTGWTCTG